MSGDMADFINDSAPDSEYCETCDGTDGFHNGGCPDAVEDVRDDNDAPWEENNEQLG